MSSVEQDLRSELLMAYVQNAMLNMQMQSTLVSVRKSHIDALSKIPEQIDVRICGELVRLERLKNDAVKVLRLLVNKGVLTQEELNEAIS